jgi:hypothetical protein
VFSSGVVDPLGGMAHSLVKYVNGSSDSRVKPGFLMLRPIWVSHGPLLLSIDMVRPDTGG